MALSPGKALQQMADEAFDSMDIVDLEETLLTCGSLGTHYTDVEAHLQENFRLAEAWDCVVLLDEADVLLDLLFRAQTLWIWDQLTNSKLRVSMWSATMGSNIEELAVSTIEERRHRVLGKRD